VPHDVDLIILLAVGFGIALIFGYIAARLRLPPFIGYLIAGIIISPNTPGIVADIHLANQLAELGVMFLMFGVGMHFSSMTYYKFVVLLTYLVLFYKLLLQLCLVWGFHVVGLEFWLSPRFWFKPVLCKYRGITQSFRRSWFTRLCQWQNCCRLALVEDLGHGLVLVLLPATAVLLGGKPLAHATDQSIWITLALPYLK
jgi:CPA2 family monovalent cation:H+ antiporter-2